MAQGRSSWLQAGCCGPLRSESADQRSLPPPLCLSNTRILGGKKKTSKTKIGHHPLRSHPQSHQMQPEATCISHTPRNVDLTRLSPPQTRAQVTLTGRPLHRLRPLCLRPVTWASLPDTGCHHTRAPPAHTGRRAGGRGHRAPSTRHRVTNFYGLRIFSKQGPHDRTSMAGGSSETTRHLKASPKEEGCPLVRREGGASGTSLQGSSGPAQTAPRKRIGEPGTGASRTRPGHQAPKRSSSRALRSPPAGTDLPALPLGAPSCTRGAISPGAGRTLQQTPSLSTPGAWPPHPQHRYRQRRLPPQLRLGPRLTRSPEPRV